MEVLESFFAGVDVRGGWGACKSRLLKLFDVSIDDDDQSKKVVLKFDIPQFIQLQE